MATRNPRPRRDARAPPANHDAFSGSGERARKLIHIAAAIGAIAVILALPQTYARATFLTAALLAIGVEIARRVSPRIGETFWLTFGALLKPGEHHRITGATTLAIGFAGATLLFPPHLALLGILYAGLADPVAALVGRRFGRRRNKFGKSLEGSLAFFATALLSAWALPWMNFPAAAAAALVVTIIEAMPLPGDDNLLIPILGAGAAFLAQATLG
jgi:dolichol kinase